MPKGKILMGKAPGKKMTPVKPKPVPMPKAKSGKPAPKGGKVLERNIQDKTAPKKNEARPENRGEAKQSMPSFLRKTKPTRRGGK
jgi:hypothetical protein